MGAGRARGIADEPKDENLNQTDDKCRAGNDQHRKPVTRPSV